MMYKMSKQTIQLSIDLEDLVYLQEIGMKYGKKNNSQAFHTLIEHHKFLTKRVKELMELSSKREETYKDIRNTQLSEEI